MIIDLPNAGTVSQVYLIPDLPKSGTDSIPNLPDPGSSASGTVSLLYLILDLPNSGIDSTPNLPDPGFSA
jgi:hypothetical protein